MNLRTSLAIGAALLGAMAGASASANLVSNGSFEAPNMVGGTYAWYGNGATTITGWTVVAPGVAVDGTQLTPDTFLGLKASDGRQWIDLTGNYGYDKGLRSDAFATVVGQHYTVSFDVGNLLWSGFGRSTVGLSINGGGEQLFANTSLATTADAPMNWAHFNVDYVATAAATTLTFLGRANGVLSNNAGIGLDNVSVQLASVSAVPEPGTWLLMLAGLVVLGAGVRRGRHGLLLAASAAALAAPAHANVLVNGSFEQPAGTAYASLPGSAATITGWTTVNSGVEWFNSAAYGSGPAADGVMVVDLANYVYTGGGIEQTFATVAGQHYALSFSLGTQAGHGRLGTAHIDVQVAGVTQGYDLTNTTGQIVWAPQVLAFQAQGASTTLRFTNNENPYLHFANVDAVSVTSAVPEPQTYTLMLAGLGALCFVARRPKASP